MAIHAICENMLIMKHVPHLSTDKEDKKIKILPKCIPVDTNQHNLTKIIDECQGLKEILADINSCDQNCSYAKWLN